MKEIKRLLAASVMVLVLSPSLAMAQLYDSNSGLRLSSPADATTTSNPYNQPNIQNDVTLKGRLTTIPQGTTMMVKLDQPVNSASAKVGDPVSAAVEADVMANNQLLVPAGSQVLGSITSVRPAGRVSRHGEIEMQFYVLKNQDGMSLPIKAHVVTADNTGIIKGNTEQARILQTAGVAVGSTAVGTLLGTAFGGLLGAAGNGAVFGVATGGIAGVGYALMRQGKEVTIPSGARLNLMVDQPVAVN